MRKVLSLAVCALALSTAPAEAASVAFSGTLSVQVAGLFPVPGVPLPPIAATGTGMASISATGKHLHSLTVPASAFSAAAVVIPITDALANPVKGVRATFHNDAGHFSGATLSGVMPLHGVTKVCLFKVCSAATANISIPLSALVGAGGSLVVQPPTSTRATTVVGAPWTAGVAAVGTLTQMGFVHGPASASSSTAQTSGVVQLVSPIFVSTTIGAYAIAPSFAILELRFAPEPSVLLLSAGGIGALVMLGRARGGVSRRRPPAAARRRA